LEFVSLREIPRRGRNWNIDRKLQIEIENFSECSQFSGTLNVSRALQFIKPGLFYSGSIRAPGGETALFKLTQNTALPNSFHKAVDQGIR